MIKCPGADESGYVQQTLKLLKLDFCVGAWFEQIIIMICTDFSEYSEPYRTPCMQTSCGIIKGAKKSTLSSTISFHSEAV